MITNAADTTTAPRAAFRVDTTRGSARHDLSRQWLARPRDQRFLSLSSMRDFLKERDDATQSDVIEPAKIEFFAPEDIESIEDTHKLWTGYSDGKEAAPTHWSFGQLSTLADFKASEMRKLPAQIAADALNYLMRQRRGGEPVKLMAYNGELRAAVGKNYGWIPDADVVEAVQQIAGNGTGDRHWKVPGTLDWSTGHYDPETPVTLDTTTLFASDRDVFIFLVDDRRPIEIGKLPDGSPDYVFRGFYVSQSSVGGGSLVLATFYLRGICCNRIMWGVERFDELRIRHTSGAPARFLEQVSPALKSYADGSDAKLIEGVKLAKAAVVASEEAEALEFLRKRGFSRKRAVDIASYDSLTGAKRPEGDFPRNVWDMSQSITAFARGIGNNDDRVEVEAIAGKLLDEVA